MRLLTAGSLVRVQQGEPEKRRRKRRLFCVWKETTNDTAVPQGPEADRRRRRREGGEGRLAKGRNASGSEQCDHFASWTVGSSPTGGATSEQSSLCSDFVFQEKQNHPHAALLLLVSQKTQDVFCESSSEINDTAVPRWARSRPPPVAEGGRRRALSKREKCERKRAVRPFCKLDESRKKRGDGKPTAAGGGGREAKGAWQKGGFRPGGRKTTILQAGRKQEEARRWKADRRRRRREGGEGRLAKGRISTGREKDGPFCKLDESRKKRGDGKPTAAGGGGREAKGAWQKGGFRPGGRKTTIFASWTKAGKSEEMESRPPPEAEGGRRRALGKREKCEAGSEQCDHFAEAGTVGSSPTGGATSEQSSLCSDFVFQEKKRRIFDFLGNDMPPFFLINVDLQFCARRAAVRRIGEDCCKWS